jgi:hypothetical protein
MRLVKCPDPNCGAYNDVGDVACAKCYGPLNNRVHAREAKKRQEKPRRQGFDDEDEIDEHEHRGSRK